MTTSRAGPRSVVDLFALDTHRYLHDKAMPKPRTKSTQCELPEASDDSDGSDAGLALRMVELLKDEHVLKELRKLLYPQEMANKLDMLTTKLEQLTEHLATKDAKIATLQTTVNKLETKIDDQEQYSRRANIRIQGIKDDVKGEDIESKVLHLLNKEMKLNPPLSSTDLERSHRLGRVAIDQVRPRTVIVRFRSERLRDVVLRSRGTLKEFNANQSQQNRIYLNEDLTARRSSLAYTTRELKKRGRITDCWTHSGRILIKDSTGRVQEVSSVNDLQRFGDA